MSRIEKYTLLAGCIPQVVHPRRPFAPLILQFIQDFRQALLTAATVSAEWKALAFLLRPSHLKKIEEEVSRPTSRLGRGLIFQIPPANMPTVFMYGFLFSLLSGNGNIIRISSRIAEETKPILALLTALWQQPDYTPLQQENAFVFYEKDDAVTAYFSSLCNGRILWGNDRTIRHLRQIPLPPQALELIFPDRYSLALIQASCVIEATEAELKTAAYQFYNDTYEADQNGCSSPRTVIWLGDPHTAQQAACRWWAQVAHISEKYPLTAAKTMLKYTQMWEASLSLPIRGSLHKYTNRLYVYSLPTLPRDISILNGTCGYFYETALPRTADIWPYISPKIQTLTVLGLSPKTIRNELIQQRVSGIDRIVPFGQALIMDTVWDGINIIDTLSRYLR